MTRDRADWWASKVLLRHNGEILSEEWIRRHIGDAVVLACNEEREACAKMLETEKASLTNYGDEQLAYEVAKSTYDNAIETIRGRKS